ncbi:MAG: DUF58 domain-containing protein [Ruminococcus sp.]|nr:DUF58 domain-containing protein [Ruminococcus sp.]
MFIIRFFYAILLIAAIIFYIMYLGDFALVLLISVIAIPVFLLISLFITKKNISVELNVQSSSVQKNQSFPVQIKVENRSIFPIGKAEANIEYFNLFNCDPVNFILHMPIQARNEQNAIFQLNSKFCGILKVRCAGITIYDPLKLFKFTVGKNVGINISVMPEGHEISGQVVYSDKVNDESNIFSEHKPGDDPSQVFDLRNYNPGDRLNRIHWKLSSKKDEFIVKDYSLPVDVPCLIFLDLKSDNELSYKLPVLDTMIESLLSLSQFLIENEKNHTVVFYNFRTSDFTELTVTDSDSLAVAVKTLVSSIDNTALCRPFSDYFTENTNISLSSFAYISSSADSKILDYIENDIDADYKNILVVIPDEEASHSLNESNGSINIIPVVIGKITSSITDIEV